MKTKKLTKGTIGFIHLKYEPYFEPSIQNNQNCSYLIYKKKAENGYKTIRINIQAGNWTILGDSNSLTEGQLSEIMPTTLMHQKHGVKTYKYQSHIDGFMGFPTALESYKSLKQELGICDENPYGAKPDETFNHPDWEWTRAKWYEAQSLARKHIVIFKED